MEACSEKISIADMAKVLSQVSGKSVDTLHMTDDYFYNAAELKEKITPELWLQYKMFYHK